MDILSLLKHFKNIVPDDSYTRTSKAALFAIEPNRIKKRSLFGTFLTHTFQVGGAMALASVLVLLIVEGFSLGNLFSPYQLGNLDTRRLRAEAEAIDAHLELANFVYVEPMQSPQSTVADQKATPSIIAPTTSSKRVEEKAEALGISVPTATSSQESLSIDDALDILSQ